MTKDQFKPLLALPLVALLAGAAFAQTEGAASSGGDKTIGSQGVWPEAVGNALFDEGFTSLRSPEEAEQRWTSLSEEERNAVKADCDRYAGDPSTPLPTVDTAMSEISAANMVSLCAMVQGF